MSGVKQATRSEQVTRTQSLTLVRNLFRTAISTILYLRNLFPEDCFSDRSVVGLNIKSLTVKNKKAKDIVLWLEDGVFDALERRYLREVVFGVFTNPDDESTLVESYNFRVSYPDEENVDISVTHTDALNASSSLSKFSNRAAVKEATVKLLRHLMALTQTLEPLPERRFLLMKLFYTEDTPSEYEPKHFKPCLKLAAPLRVRGEEVESLRMGSVTTGFHTFDLKVTLDQGGEGTGRKEKRVEPPSPEEPAARASFSARQTALPRTPSPQPRRKSKTKRSSLAVQSMREGVLAVIRKRPSNLQDLVRTFHVPPAQLRPILADLRRSGRVEGLPSGLFRAHE